MSPGGAECSLALDWPASATPHEVALSVPPIVGRPPHASPAACGAPIATVSAGALAAIASRGEEARVVAELAGEATACEQAYPVTRGTSGAPLPEREALAGVASPTCLPAGTPIAVPGGEVAIEALVPGDVVESFDVRRRRRVRATVLGVWPTPTGSSSRSPSTTGSCSRPLLITW